MRYQICEMKLPDLFDEEFLYCALKKACQMGRELALE